MTATPVSRNRAATPYNRLRLGAWWWRGAALAATAGADGRRGTGHDGGRGQGGNAGFETSLSYPMQLSASCCMVVARMERGGGEYGAPRHGPLGRAPRGMAVQHGDRRRRPSALGDGLGNSLSHMIHRGYDHTLLPVLRSCLLLAALLGGPARTRRRRPRQAQPHRRRRPTPATPPNRGRCRRTSPRTTRWNSGTRRAARCTSPPPPGHPAGDDEGRAAGRHGLRRLPARRRRRAQPARSPSS